MTDRGVFGLLGIIAVVAIVLFLMTPHGPGTTGQKMRDTVRQEIGETTDRLESAFDAAKRDVERGGHR